MVQSAYMAKLSLLTLRLPERLVAEADSLIPVAAERRELSTQGSVSRAAVLRLAIALGLSEIRRDAQAPLPPVPTRRRTA